MYFLSSEGRIDLRDKIARKEGIVVNIVKSMRDAIKKHYPHLLTEYDESIRRRQQDISNIGRPSSGTLQDKVR